jgi:hypothetical protein
MNRTIAVVIFAISFPLTTFSQVMGGTEPFLEYGVKLGADLQHVSTPIKGGIGAIAGAYARKDIAQFGVRIEVLGSYGSLSTKYPAAYYSIYSPGMDTTTKGAFQVIGVAVPLLAEYSVSEKLQVVAGVQYRYLVSVSDKNDVYTNLYGKDKFIKAGDFSVVAGVEYSIKKKIKLGARIMKGVTDINNSIYYLAPRSWTTTGAQFTISYKIK